MRQDCTLQKNIHPLRAFTLIELLVVIAIIGILSSVILAALNTARAKGNDASIKTNLNSVMTQAELYYDNYNTYGTQAATYATAGSSCGTAGMFSDTTIANATKAASQVAGSATLDSQTTKSTLCFSSGSAWAVAVTLSTTPTQVWCVDSTGKSENTNISGYIDTAANVTAHFTACP